MKNLKNYWLIAVVVLALVVFFLGKSTTKKLSDAKN